MSKIQNCSLLNLIKDCETLPSNWWWLRSTTLIVLCMLPYVNISWGILPLKLFPCRFNVSRELPNHCGILPSNLFACQSKISSWDEDIFWIVRGPLNWLEARNNFFKEGTANKHEGITPSKLLPERSKIFNWVRFPSEAGICPLKLLISRFKICSFVRFPNEDGIWPLRLLLETDKNLTVIRPS